MGFVRKQLTNMAETVAVMIVVIELARANKREAKHERTN